MAEALSSELNKPLGQGKPQRPRRPYGRWLAYGVAATTGITLAGLGLFSALVSHPDGGQPVASARIETKSASPVVAIAPAEPTPVASEPRRATTAAEMEAESGVTVVRSGAEAPSAVVIRVPDAQGTVKLAPSPDRRLIERSRHGQLPKIGEDGATAAQVYSRPVIQPAGTKPAGRIAILVGGLGISASATADAIARLPGPISFAFAPYGGELERSVARARSEGHEVFLQLPMEPFDYPDNDPGPHTLLTGPRASENIERLHWSMARFTGYVGIVNFLGGRFTADEAALQPVITELAGRGLMLVDDGSSARSLLGSGTGRAPVAKADLVIDATVRADAIDRELARLETLAREKGLAIGSATALPMTVDRIARWSRTLEARGILLVPVSATARRGPATTGSIR